MILGGNMPGRVRFGPAGRPIDYVGPTPAIPAYLKALGLDAFEYQAVRGVKISDEDAMNLKEQSLKHDVLLSLHAPYYINFSSAKSDVIRKSIRWLVLAAEACYKMGAYVAVFHPGYYGGKDPREALELVENSLKRVEEELKLRGIKGVFLGAETTGKISQVGSLEEVIELSSKLENVKPIIDWAHLHARSLGEQIRSVDEIIGIIDLLEKEVGSKAIKPLHTHFSRIEYGKGGEREHHVLDERSYGPEFTVVCKGLREVGVDAVIISESPLLDKDALLMKRIFMNECKE